MKAVALLLEGLGEDVNATALRETPRRVADMYEEILRGREIDPKDVIKVFETENYSWGRPMWPTSPPATASRA